MSESAMASGGTAQRLLNKVPEVTVWFWIIKIRCTTVRASKPNPAKEQKALQALLDTLPAT